MSKNEELRSRSVEELNKELLELRQIGRASCRERV